MTIAIFWPLVVGILIGALIVAVFDATRFWAQHEWAKEANATIREQTETITDLESRMVPTKWDEPPPYEEMRERVPELLEAGTEVIRIDTLDDVPDIEGWRGRVGDEQA